MSSERERDLPLEIGHVLFVDIVGYSKLLINEQSELLEHLKEMVRGSEQVRAAGAEGKLIRLATGDGMALVFRNSPEAPAQCALELSRADKDHPELKLRMGIHSGPINEVKDLNDRINVTGAGINMAQRVMDCGDAGHILLSKRSAEDLAQYRHWQPFLHDIGECEVKHGVRLGLVNLYRDDLGNPALPENLRNAPAVKRQIPWPALFILLVSLGATIFGIVLFYQNSPPPRPLPAAAPAPSSPAPAKPGIPEKSIAVLPFENLSEEKANAYFADGIQDEILTNLSRIAALKVISRTSVMPYRTGTTRDLREIGKQLGVAHLLEGSVQRNAGKVRVIAQLIDARTDAHLWAETYDRDLADVFAIQSDIARSIAAQLQAKLAPAEKARLAAKPTDNSEAYLLYLQANKAVYVAASRDDVVRADELFSRAIALDPGFALARARASMLNSLMYFVGREPQRKTRARLLADEAFRLAPALGEAHLALALCFYRLEAKYEKALGELAIAGAALPNNSEILDFYGFVYRRQGRWRDALAAFARARELDPRRAHFDGTPDTLRALRRWADANEAFSAGLKLEPQLIDGWLGLAYIQFAQSGNPSLATATLEHLPAAMKTKPGSFWARWDYAMLARDFVAAAKVIPDRPANELAVFGPKEFYEGCVAFAQGDVERARSFFEAALPIYEAGVKDQPEDPKFHAELGRLQAMLRRKESAIAEARRAVELRPESKDAVAGPLFTANLAFVYAQTGEVDQAVTLLSRLLTTPSAERITFAHLRLSWEWDPLRQDPRFQKMLEGPEPATVYH
ncbi:MAG: tetratricopeptide repeat protein [Spartobacteria bacterium]